MIDVTPIRTEAAPQCPVCGRPGTPLHAGLQDLLYEAPGVFSLDECAGCGVAWLNPRPISDDLGRCYQGYYTHQFHPAPAVVASGGRLRGVRNWLRSSILAGHYGLPVDPQSRPNPVIGRALAAVPALRTRATFHTSIFPKWSGRGRLLDVGCGNGEFSARMQRFGWDVTGIEVDASAAETARKERGLRVITGTLEEASLSDESFDVVVLHHVIEHVIDPLGLLEECFRVLARGGEIFVVTPNIRSLGHRWFGKSWRGLEQPRHLTLWSTRALSECLRRVGFEVVRMRTRALIAGIIWEQSSQMRSGRRADRRAEPKFAGRLFAYLERALLLVDRKVGEEIVCIARRP